MTAQQLDMFVSDDSSLALLETKENHGRLNKLRRGLFACYGDMAKNMLQVINRLESLEKDYEDLKESHARLMQLLQENPDM